LRHVVIYRLAPYKYQRAHLAFFGKSARIGTNISTHKKDNLVRDFQDLVLAVQIDDDYNILHT